MTILQPEAKEEQRCQHAIVGKGRITRVKEIKTTEAIVSKGRKI